MATVTMPLRLKGTLTARWRWVKPAVAMNMIASDPTTMRVLTDIAETIAGKARTGVGISMKEPPNVQHHRMLPPKTQGAPWTLDPNGTIWWAAPGNVAASITVKDSGKVFELKSGKVVPRTTWAYSVAGSVAVALVIANHPYSASYEVGGEGIPGKAYMRQAARSAAAFHPGVKYEPSRSLRGKGFI